MTDSELLEKFLQEQQKQTKILAHLGLFINRICILGLVLGILWVLAGIIQLLFG